MVTEVCTSCNGTGKRWVDEPGHPAGGVMDACYRCGMTGVCEVSLTDEVDELIGAMADASVSASRKAADNDPEGEGWGFAAAENGMREYEYTKCVTWDREERLRRDFAKLEESTLRSLVRLFKSVKE